MSNLILDSEVIEKLRVATGPCWLRDAEGNLIGYYHPGKLEVKPLEEGEIPELSQDEYERRVAEGGGRSWAEIKRDLERLA